MWTVNSAIRADWKLIGHCTEADPISHCRKNTQNVFASVHAYQRDDCQAILMKELANDTHCAKEEDLQLGLMKRAK